jgi:hypothetical protein
MRFAARVGASVRTLSIWPLASLASSSIVFLRGQSFVVSGIVLFLSKSRTLIEVRVSNVVVITPSTGCQYPVLCRTKNGTDRDIDCVRPNFLRQRLNQPGNGCRKCSSNRSLSVVFAGFRTWRFVQARSASWLEQRVIKIRVVRLPSQTHFRFHGEISLIDLRVLGGFLN